MKSINVFLFILVSTFYANAQENAKQCAEKSESIDKLIKDEKFEDAAKTWTDINKTCTNINNDFFLNGEKIFLHNLELVNSKEQKNAVITDLIKVYDSYDKKFPDNKNGNAIKKALLLHDNKLATNEEIYAILNADFIKNKATFDNPKALYIYFETLLSQYKLGNKGILTDDLYTKHIEIAQKVAENEKSINEKISTLLTKQKEVLLTNAELILLQQNQDDLYSYKTVTAGTDSLLQPYITCENLTFFCKNKFETNQNNIFWLNYTAAALLAKSCVSDPIFEAIVTKANSINPSSKTAFDLGYISLLKNDIPNASLLFNKAANLETDTLEKAKTYYTIATIVYGINDKLNCYTYLKKTLEIDPTYGRAYLFLAQLYESSINECTTTPFEKKAMYWLDSKTVQKAGEVDKTLTASTKIQAESYLKKAPSKAEISQSGKAGKKIMFNCWIDETIHVPNIK